jgi:hypothetical protein
MIYIAFKYFVCWELGVACDELGVGCGELDVVGWVLD